ncbi:hypothetical protein [Rhizobium sp. G21]|uniref:hypothetical protein n=1 Tax=Rhizobium sp. G21 TaxID=2758439 RepID=UPI001602A0BB|nr:hypothetical protein [Rhizobium sp. G21]MBB1249437.1 hypothetical protein [Rhizobium sp. G21]
MHDKSNSDSKPAAPTARQIRSSGLSEWDHAAMTRAVWALADCPVLKLFVDTTPVEHRLIH